MSRAQLKFELGEMSELLAEYFLSVYTFEDPSCWPVSTLEPPMFFRSACLLLRPLSKMWLLLTFPRAAVLIESLQVFLTLDILGFLPFFGNCLTLACLQEYSHTNSRRVMWFVPLNLESARCHQLQTNYDSIQPEQSVRGSCFKCHYPLLKQAIIHEQHPASWLGGQQSLIFATVLCIGCPQLQVNTIYVDFSKAFDWINHSICLEKL